MPVFYRKLCLKYKLLKINTINGFYCAGVRGVSGLEKVFWCYTETLPELIGVTGVTARGLIEIAGRVY